MLPRPPKKPSRSLLRRHPSHRRPGRRHPRRHRRTPHRRRRRIRRPAQGQRKEEQRQAEQGPALSPHFGHHIRRHRTRSIWVSRGRRPRAPAQCRPIIAPDAAHRGTGRAPTPPCAGPADAQPFALCGSGVRPRSHLHMGRHASPSREGPGHPRKHVGGRQAAERDAARGNGPPNPRDRAAWRSRWARRRSSRTSSSPS